MDIQGILGMDSDVRNGYDDIKVTFEIDADASKEDIEAIVAQSQKRSAVYDALTNPVNVTVEVVKTSSNSRRSSSGPVTPASPRAGFSPKRSIDHVLLERGDVANSWRRERWESLRLLTPNWQSRLPGHRYDGPDPDGYMTMPEVIEFISRFADGVERAGSHQYERHVGDTHGRRVSHRDDQRRYPLPVRRARERRVQSAERSGASSSRCRRLSSRSPRSTITIRPSCPTGVRSSSVRRPPACSSPPRFTARGDR